MLHKLSDMVLHLYRGCREIRVDEFQDWAFDALRPVLTFDSAVWLTAVAHDHDDSGTIHTLHVFRQPPWLVSEWMKCKDATAFPRRLARSPGICVTCTPSIEMSPEVAAHCRRYHIEQVLSVLQLDPIGGIYEMTSLYRSDIAHPFSEEERLFQQHLFPHLSEAWRISRWLHLASSGQSGHSSPSRYAAADEQGILHLVDAEFTGLMTREWPSWRGPRLPHELAATIKQGGRRFTGNHIVVTLSTIHNQVMLQAREKSVVDTLGQSKLAVARHFSDGRTHKEIAQLLGLAPATVRNYLAFIYDRLGVSSKVELANILRRYT